MSTRSRLILCIGSICAAALAHAEAPKPLEPLAFLLGEWRAEGSGKPGERAGASTFTSALQDRVMLRTSYAEYPAAAGRPAFRHDDLMVIHVGPAGDLRADYYDSEGHVIRYAVTAIAGREAVFLADAIPSSPRFRLTYKLDPTGLLSGRFEIAPPGTPETFSEYLKWTARRAPAEGDAKRP